MSSYRQLLYHIVFRTKYGHPTINPEYKTELFKYIWGIIKNRNSTLYQINGIEDHIHIITDIHPSIAVADFVKEIKVASSIWMKGSGKFPKFVGWAEGYGAFSYNYRNKKIVVNYIKNQEEHHKKVNYKKEYIKLLKEHGVNYDERYI